MIEFDKILKPQHRKYGDYFILSKDSELIGFYNDNEALRTKTTFLNDTNKNLFISRLNNLEHRKYKQSDYDKLLNKLKTLEDKSSFITRFEITSDWIEAIKDSANFYKSTHIRFFNDNNAVRVNLFDYRQYRTDIITLKEQNLIVVTETIPDAIVNKTFSASLLARAFDKMAVNDYAVEITNDYVFFDSLSDERVEYGLATQNVIEPILKFQHETIKENCSLLFSWSNDDTNTSVELQELNDEQIERTPDELELEYLKTYYSKTLPKVIQQERKNQQETKKEITSLKRKLRTAKGNERKAIESRLKKHIKYAPIVNDYIAELEIEYETIKKENFSDKAYEKRFNKRKELRGKKHKDTAVKKVEKYKQEKGDVMITFLTNKKSKEKYMLIQRKNNHFLIKSDKSITTRFQNKTTDEVKRILANNFK